MYKDLTKKQTQTYIYREGNLIVKEKNLHILKKKHFRIEEAERSSWSSLHVLHIKYLTHIKSRFI
jgi:hypothetical protein